MFENVAIDIWVNFSLLFVALKALLVYLMDISQWGKNSFFDQLIKT
jgi:hypothetical protein